MPRPDYEFQSALYRNESEMLTAIIDAFLSADGLNTPEIIKEILDSQTDTQLAEECIAEWGLDYIDPYSYDDDPRSHMGQNGYSSSDLQDAFAAYRKQGQD